MEYGVRTLNKELLCREIPEILAIDKEVTKEMGALFTDKEWSYREFFMELKSKWIYSKVAYVSRKVVGYLIASEKCRRIKIHRIAVIKGYRGEGIGKKMYRKLLGEAMSSNIDEILLEVHMSNRQAIKLYEKIGFAKSDKWMKDDCYLYRKRIK